MDDTSGTIPLFRHYPLLRDGLPCVPLGEFPTPVQKLNRTGEDIGLHHLYIKRDDLSGKIYGGNKVRKLEFLLGNALRAGVKEVLTFGATGSNHALATAVYAQQVGLKSISMLIHQPKAHYVRRNLLMSHHHGAELHLYPNIPFIMPLAALAIAYQLMRHRVKHGHFPKVIPAGGSSPPGVTGFVNAAFELKEQIEKGELPEPDDIYVAAGTTGTAAGLVLGLRAAKLKSRVISVQVAGENFANVKGMLKLIRQTNSLLCSLDTSFPRYDFSVEDIDFRHGFFGQQYALFTEEGIEAVNLMEKNEGIRLEGTYTGKTFACLIDDARKQDIKDRVLLFWNTHNSRDFSDIIATVDYHRLPRCFHCYFEQEVQPLDRQSL